MQRLKNGTCAPGKRTSFNKTRTSLIALEWGTQKSAALCSSRKLFKRWTLLGNSSRPREQEVSGWPRSIRNASVAELGGVVSLALYWHAHRATTAIDDVMLRSGNAHSNYEEFFSGFCRLVHRSGNAHSTMKNSSLTRSLSPHWWMVIENSVSKQVPPLCAQHTVGTCRWS